MNANSFFNRQTITNINNKLRAVGQVFVIFIDKLNISNFNDPI